jgi:hypothetical protein
MVEHSQMSLVESASWVRTAQGLVFINIEKSRSVSALSFMELLKFSWAKATYSFLILFFKFIF